MIHESKLKFSQIILGLFALMLLARPLNAWPATPNVLTKNGLGNIHIGMSYSSVRHLPGIDLIENKDQDPSGHCFFAIPVKRQGIHLMFVEGRLSRIDIDGAVEREVSTENDVTIGDSAYMLKNIYHDKLEKIPSDGDGYTLIAPHPARASRSTAYFIENGKVTWLYAGTVSALKQPEDCL